MLLVLVVLLIVSVGIVVTLTYRAAAEKRSARGAYDQRKRVQRKKTGECGKKSDTQQITHPA